MGRIGLGICRVTRNPGLIPGREYDLRTYTKPTVTHDIARIEAMIATKEVQGNDMVLQFST